MADRRHFLKQAGAAAALLTLPTRARTQVGLSSGGVRLDTLSDGNLVLPRSALLGDMPSNRALAILEHYGLTGDTVTPDCNITLLRNGPRTVLFDVGAGADFMPSAGKLGDALDALGVDPFDVTDVIFTHAHPDHLWGLFDDFGDFWFPQAAYHIGADEWNYWTDPNTVSTIRADRQSFAVGAANRLDAIADRITLVADGASVVPGVTARATPGHTPGHMSYVAELGNDPVMIVGDAIGNHHLGFERPSWHSGADQDAGLGAKTRAGLLDQLASDQMHLVGFHLPGGGLGRAEKRDDGYVFVSEDT